eukprot:7150640-Pyramimonas_sp.AAC.1
MAGKAPTCPPPRGGRRPVIPPGPWFSSCAANARIAPARYLRLLPPRPRAGRSHLRRPQRRYGGCC